MDSVDVWKKIEGAIFLEKLFCNPPAFHDSRLLCLTFKKRVGDLGITDIDIDIDYWGQNDDNYNHDVASKELYCVIRFSFLNVTELLLPSESFINDCYISEINFSLNEKGLIDMNLELMSWESIKILCAGAKVSNIQIRQASDL